MGILDRGNRHELKGSFEVACLWRRWFSGAAAVSLLPVLLLVDAVYAPLLVLALARGAAVGAGLLVRQFAPQLQEAVVAGLIQPPVGQRAQHFATRLVDVGAVGEGAVFREPGEVVEGGVHVGPLGPQLQLADAGA